MSNFHSMVQLARWFSPTMQLFSYSLKVKTNKFSRNSNGKKIEICIAGLNRRVGYATEHTDVAVFLTSRSNPLRRCSYEPTFRDVPLTYDLVVYLFTIWDHMSTEEGRYRFMKLISIVFFLRKRYSLIGHSASALNISSHPLEYQNYEYFRGMSASV